MKTLNASFKSILCGFVMLFIGFIQEQSFRMAAFEAGVASISVAMICWLLVSWAANSSTRNMLERLILAFISNSLGFFIISNFLIFKHDGEKINLLISIFSIIVLFGYLTIIVPKKFKSKVHKRYVPLCIIPLGFGVMFGTFVMLKNESFKFQKA